MNNETITYQLAMHYLPNIASRLEALFSAITQACHETHPIIHHYALKNIISIIKIIEKPELKSRFIKEFMRLEHYLNRPNYQDSFHLSNTLYANVFVTIQVLQNLSGKFGESIYQDPFLQSIRFAQFSNSDECELHSPQLVHWLAQDSHTRQSHLTKWLQELIILHDTVNIYLKILRDTVNYEPISLINGYYHQFIPNKSTCQLILLRMLKDCNIVPKIQLGHHGLSIRLCDSMTMQEIEPSNANIELAISKI